MLSRKQLLNLVLSSWTTLLSGELMSQSLSIENAIEGVGKMCHKCLSEYDKYLKLHTQLKDRLHVAMTKMNEPAVITSTSVSVATSTRKRKVEGDESSLGYNCSSHYVMT